MKGCYYPRKGGMKSEQKRGTTAIKEEEINEEMDRKTERRESSAKLKPNHFLYELLSRLQTIIESKLHRFSVNTLY